MARYKALQSFPIQHPNNPKRGLLVRAGEEVELADDLVADHAIGVTIERIDKDPAEPVDGPDAVVELPARPSNGGTKEAWLAYLNELEKVTADELGPLSIPEGAKRDDLIIIGDDRVAEWKDEG